MCDVCATRVRQLDRDDFDDLFALYLFYIHIYTQNCLQEIESNLALHTPSLSLSLSLSCAEQGRCLFRRVAICPTTTLTSSGIG
jgi:hypothetical protein